MTKKSKRSRDSSDSDSEEDKKTKKKAEKKVAKVAKLLGYSNDVNPFGDSNLLTPFVWGKKETSKEESDSDNDRKSRKKSSKHNKDKERDKEKAKKEKQREEEKRLELLAEIDKVRKRRQTREEELSELERLRDEEQRLKEMAAFGDWQRKEEEFILEQTKEKAKIRLIEERERRIDYIVKNLLLVEAAEELLVTKGKDYSLDNSNKNIPLLQLSVELTTANEIFEKCNYHDLCTLQDDVAAFAELDGLKSNNRHVQYWQALTNAINIRKKRLSSSNNSINSSNNNTNNGLHEAISDEVAELLQDKTTDQLDTLEADIRRNLSSAAKGTDQHSSTIDVEYWELLLQEVRYQRAKSTIVTLHKQYLEQLLTLIQRLRDEQIIHTPTEDELSTSNYQKNKKKKGTHENGNENDNAQLVQSSGSLIDELAVQQYLREMENYSHSSALFGDSQEPLQPNEIMSNNLIKMPERDEIPLPSTLSSSMHTTSSSTTNTQYQGVEKYRPRKPRYFNRVRTGWVRSKYNLSHYDHDNPPPKMIMGYKFTIFYPDLIDKQKAPRYFLEPCPPGMDGNDGSEGNEFVIIRFHAGPPYEDIAFKILNREWDIHKHAGFTNVFDRGILQLNFNFKRVFYRR